MTDTAAGIEVFVHAIGIPAEEFFLLVPGEGAFCSHRLLEYDIAFLFETKQDFLWQRASLAERDKIRAALLLEMRKHPPKMEATNERVGVFV
jgi:hypothetical protein